MCMFRVVELQSKLDDQAAEHHSLADSASSPVEDELHGICDVSFSSDRPSSYRSPLPPPPLPSHPFFGYRPSPGGFMPPFCGRQPLSPPADRLHSPPAFHPYHDDRYVRQSPGPQDVLSPVGRRPLAPEHQRSAPPFDSHREDAYMARSPPPKGYSPPHYERRYGRRSPPTSDGYHHDERYGRHSPPPRARNNSPQRRDRYSRQDRSRTPSDEESSAVPSGSSHVRSRAPGEEKHHQLSSLYPARHGSARNTVVPDTRPLTVRSPPTMQRPSDDDDYPTY